MDGRTGKNGSEPSKNRPKSDPERGKTRKSGLYRAKNESNSSKKCRKLSLKRGKVEKTEISGRKRGGGVEGKNGLYCRFCHAMKWQNGRK